MNKFKVGQRVKIKATGNVGEILKVHSPDISSIGYSNHCYVIEVGCCCYDFTVHDLEEVKDILNSREKEYLSNVIKPFRDSAINIKKFENYRDRQKEYITIYIKNDFAINLPNFEKNTMYKNMEINKAYTLEELGL
mgnify:CR=1 FL=1|jgi:hypothetical protein